MTDAELYSRGARTLLASWEEYARASPCASLQRLPGVAAAVFPNEPERAVYNNALLERDLADGPRAQALEAMEAAYAGAGITHFAVWVHESDEPLRVDVERRGYAFETSTRAMGMTLDDVPTPRPELDLADAGWLDHLRVGELPPDLLHGGDLSAFHIVVARLNGERVSTAIAFDHRSDCGIYNVGTLERARRRGLGTAITALLLSDAVGRGCETASVQSTEMAEGVYAAVGFRDLGRILEYVPSP